MKNKLFQRKTSVIRMFFSVICILGVIMSLSSGVFASELPKYIDDGSNLPDIDGGQLEAKLNSISESTGMDVVILVIYSLGYKTSEEYADDYFDYNGYGQGDERDGILFLISMEGRDWAFSTSGNAINLFTDRTLQYMFDSIKGDLSVDDFESAFNKFADLVLEIYETGPVKTPITRPLLISLAIGLVLSLIILSAMKAKLKSVRMSRSATFYVLPGSLNLTEQKDIFLYTHVTKTEIPRESSSGGGGSSTHTSSSGRTHGGASGKF